MIRWAAVHAGRLDGLPPDAEHPVLRLRVWDFKGSQIARHEHFIQVAFYGMLLESVLQGFGITSLAVDIEQGVVESRKERFLGSLVEIVAAAPAQT